MRVSDVFTLAADSGSGGDSYSNFGCSAGDCYAGDYGRYSYNYYSVYNPSAGNYGGYYNGGLRNESASRGEGFDRIHRELPTYQHLRQPVIHLDGHRA